MFYGCREHVVNIGLVQTGRRVRRCIYSHWLWCLRHGHKYCRMYVLTKCRVFEPTMKPVRQPHPRGHCKHATVVLRCSSRTRSLWEVAVMTQQPATITYCSCGHSQRASTRWACCVVPAPDCIAGRRHSCWCQQHVCRAYDLIAGSYKLANKSARHRARERHESRRVSR